MGSRLRALLSGKSVYILNVLEKALKLAPLNLQFRLKDDDKRYRFSTNIETSYEKIIN